MFSKQEVFDAVAKHLLKQGERAVEGNSCAYRAADGKKCAIGALITDEAYGIILEGSGVESLQVILALARSGVVSVNGTLRDEKSKDATTAFFMRLQEIHDWCDDASKWPEKLLAFAIKEKLSFTYTPPAAKEAPVEIPAIPSFASNYPATKYFNKPFAPFDFVPATVKG